MSAGLPASFGAFGLHRDLRQVVEFARADDDVEEQAGQHENEDGQNLDHGAEERADPGVILVLRPQDPLHDRLVGAEVPDADDGVAQAGSRTRKTPCRPAGERSIENWPNCLVWSRAWVMTSQPPTLVRRRR